MLRRRAGAASWCGSRLALLVLAAALWWVQHPIDWTALQATPWQRAGVLGGVIGAAAALYFVALLALGLSSARLPSPRRA